MMEVNKEKKDSHNLEQMKTPSEPPPPASVPTSHPSAKLKNQQLIQPVQGMMDQRHPPLQVAPLGVTGAVVGKYQIPKNINKRMKRGWEQYLVLDQINLFLLLLFLILLLLDQWECYDIYYWKIESFWMPWSWILPHDRLATESFFLRLLSDDLIQFNNEALETSSDFEAKIRLNQLLLFQLERDQVLLKDEVDKGMKSVGQILSENYNTLNDSIESLKMFNN